MLEEYTDGPAAVLRHQLQQMEKARATVRSLKSLPDSMVKNYFVKDFFNISDLVAGDYIVIWSWEKATNKFNDDYPEAICDAGDKGCVKMRLPARLLGILEGKMLPLIAVHGGTKDLGNQKTMQVINFLDMTKVQSWASVISNT